MRLVSSSHPDDFNQQSLTLYRHPGSQPPSTHALPSSHARDAGLERLRIAGTLLVVWLHAAIAFITFPLPGLAWPVHQSSTSWPVNVSFWWVQCSIMPLFFTLSGVAAWYLIARKSGWAFFRHRSQRLLGPMLFATLVILPFELYLWAIGWVVTGRYPPTKLRSLKFSAQDAHDLFGFAHLWYLLYLWIHTVILLGMYELTQRIDIYFPSNGVRFQQAFKPYLWAIAGGAFYLATVGCWSSSPLMTLGFRHGFFPYLAHVAYYALFFGLGFHIGKRPELCTHLSGWRYLTTAISLILFTTAYPQIQASVASGLQNQHAVVTCAWLIPLIAIMTTLSALLWASRWQHPLSALERFTAGSCFWLYLAHHPVVGLVHLSFWQLDQTGLVMPTFVKAVLTFGLAGMFCLVSYEWCVRTTWIGRLLNGKTLPGWWEDDSYSNAITNSSPAPASRRAA